MNKLYIVLEIYSDDDSGYMCPVFLSKEEAEKEYPNTEIIEISFMFPKYCLN